LRIFRENTQVASFCAASTLAAFPQTCCSWREAVAERADELWRNLVAADFPRALLIVKHLPSTTVCFKHLYREQHVAQSGDTPKHDACVCPTL
jgi:hypothetical protein